MASPNGPATGFDFTDAPGGDISLDDLFPSPEGNSSAETPAELSGQPQPAQSTPPAPEDFLRSPDGKIVYKSADDALRGMAEKDRVIEQLRQEFIAREGYDPISKRRVNPQQPQPNAPQSQPEAPQSYLQNPMKFYQDQVEAVKANDAAKYTQTQLKLVEEYLAPLAPLVADLARSRALQSVETTAPDAKSFVGSQEYQKVLESKPALSRAIQAAEQNFQFYGDLPELYSLAWEAHQTSRLPELLRAQTNQGPVVPNTPPARPTTTSTSTLTPPTQPAAPKDFRTHEGRMSIIREAEGRGVDKVVW